MSQQANYFKLGIFVIVTTVALLIGVAILGAADRFKPKLVIETYLSESVEGLSVGSEVKHLGVAIGRVQSIGFLREVYQETQAAESTYKFRNVIVVEMALEVDIVAAISTPGSVEVDLKEAVKHGLRAQLSKSGLTGPTYIDLAYTNVETHPLPDLGWQPRNLWVPSRPSTIQAFIDQLKSLLNNVGEINIADTVQRVNRLLDNGNRVLTTIDAEAIQADLLAFVQELRQTNKNIQGLTGGGSLAQFVADLPEISGNAVQASDRLKQILAQPGIQVAVERLPVFMASLESVAARLEAILNKPALEQALDDLPGAVAGIDHAAERVADAAVGVQDLTSDQRHEIEAILENIRLLTGQANELVQRLEATPSSVLLSTPPPALDPANP